MTEIHKKFSTAKSDCALFVEAGYVAIKQIDEDAAKKCFYAAMLMNPDECMPVVGLGTVHLFKLEIEEAKKMFNLVLQKEPDHHMAKTMLGIANLYSISEEGLKEGHELIDEAMSGTKDSELKNLGKHTKELHKEIKKKMKDLHPLEKGKQQSPKKRLK